MRNKRIMKNLLHGLKNNKYEKPFYVRFVKRTNGEIRHMVGMFGVKKGLKGVGHSFNPEKRGLLSVYDIVKGGYRFINLRTLLDVRVKVPIVIKNTSRDVRDVV